MSIKLEIGKKYVCRNNSIVELVDDRPDDFQYPFKGKLYPSGKFVLFSKSGCYFYNGEDSDLDLVSEYVEPSVEKSHKDANKNYTIEELKKDMLTFETETEIKLPSMPFRDVKIDTNGYLEIGDGDHYYTVEEAKRLAEALAKFYLPELF